MTKIILFISVISFACVSHATKQIDDTLRVGNSIFHITARPLHSLDEWNSFAKETKFEFCTASWRGYRASWKINKGYLWLEDIEKNPCKFGNEAEEEIEAREFSGRSEYPVKAGWFTGEILIQVDETEYLFKNDDEEEEMIGSNYEALVYTFRKGKLSKKKLKIIKNRFEH